MEIKVLCEHNWHIFEKSEDGAFCTKGCRGRLSREEAEALLNEHAALKEYATHKPGCYENSELCICGLDALLKEQDDA